MSGRLRIAVCDDESRAISVISASVESVFREQGQDILLDSFLSPKDLLDSITGVPYDLIFLDIHMPDMDGVELGKALKQSGSKAELVFVSSRMDRMFDTFAVQPFGFVRKSHFLDDINEVILRYIEKHAVPSENRLLAHFQDQQSLVAVDLAHVTYIECIRNTQVLHFDDPDKAQKLYSRMETLEEELARYDFIRVHKGYLVNCRFIRRIDSKGVTLLSGVEIPVGRSRYKDAMAAYMAWVSHSGSAFLGQ